MPKPTPNTFQRVARMILRRYQSNAHKSLTNVYQLDRDFLTVDAEGLEFMMTERDGILQVLEDAELIDQLVDLFVTTSIQFTYSNNQFIHFDREETGTLTRLYRAYLVDMKQVIRSCASLDALDAGMAALLQRHFRDLSANLERFFDAELAQQIQENVILKKAVCGEYSPQLQLDILGIDPGSLVAPVLDIGCGKTGRLVRYLRAQGIEAHGVDRVVETENFLTEKDWFELQLRPGSWGTILSHLAFSNHFVFHHLYKHGNPRQYAQQYMAILGALVPGGSFVYAPGLPFIEQFLPERHFCVGQRDLGELDLTQISLSDSLQQDTWYAARITRQGGFSYR